MQALCHAVLMFDALPVGFSNLRLRQHLAPLLGVAPDQIKPAMPIPSVVQSAGPSCMPRPYENADRYQQWTTMVSKHMALKWKIAAMVFAIAALNYADRTAISSVFPLLRAELGITDAVMAGIGSLFLWSYAIGSPFAGYIADRFSRTRIVIISLVAWSAVTALTSLVHSSSALLATRVLLGLTECAYLPAAIALLAEHHGPETRATAMGFHIAGMNLGLIGGSALAGYLGQQLGWRMDFVVLGGFGFVLAIVAMFVLRDAPREPAEASTGTSGWLASFIYCTCRPTSRLSSAQC